MDPRLLHHYERELRYLRGLGGEFAREFPKIAGHLGLDAFDCADPYVERLLEGSALLAARVQLEMEAQFPRFTEHVLGMVSPHLLCPKPSMAVTRFEPNVSALSSAQGGVRVPAGTRVTASPTSQRSEVVYCTGSDVTLWPVKITALRHSRYLGDVAEFSASCHDTVRSTFRIEIQSLAGVPLSTLALDELPLFVRGDRGHRLHELLAARVLGLAVRSKSSGRVLNSATSGVRQLGLESDDCLLPSLANSFSGYRRLQEYFALPSRFMFVALEGLREALAQLDPEDETAEIVVLLDSHDPDLENGLEADQLLPFCAPAINLFEKSVDRIRLSDRDHEYHVVPDRTRPSDFEVHSILSVQGMGSRAGAKREFRPLFASTDATTGQVVDCCYAVHREVRRRSAKSSASSQRGANASRSLYRGSETFLALTDSSSGAFAHDLQQLSVRALCTNRDLPLLLTPGEGGSELSSTGGAPIESIRFVAGPSHPKLPLSTGPRAWRLLNHLSLNYLSLQNAAQEGATPLRELLGIYADEAEPGLRRQVAGLLSLESTPVVRRLPLQGPATFARGLSVELTCDESAFEGSGTFLLGSILDRFFSGYASINGFVQTSLSSKQRGRITTFPLRVGTRPAL